eukprot:13090352-Heterocapsa_arctica.AAC.1
MPAEPVVANVPRPLPAGSRQQVGSPAVHPTHKSAFVRGVMFCHRCGSWCNEKPRNMGKPCVSLARES